MQVGCLFIRSFRSALAPRLRDIFVLSPIVWFFPVSPDLFLLFLEEVLSRSVVPLRPVSRFSPGYQTNPASPTVVFYERARARRGTFPPSSLPLLVLCINEIKLVLFHGFA